MSTSPFESETTPEEYRQRALLFADLGRYDEAAGEIAAGLAAAPDDAPLLATLARVHIAAEQPAEAMVAAERAVAAAPGEVTPLVVRAMALTDNRRFADAARVAGEILRAWPDDAFAQRTGAALLSESRNGQEALNAAWRGVQLADTEAEAHLVLAMVAARLRLFDLAQHAYARALDLDEAIGGAQDDVGIVRLERRRWARALEDLADEAALGAAGARQVTEPKDRPPMDPPLGDGPSVDQPSVDQPSADQPPADRPGDEGGGRGTREGRGLWKRRRGDSPAPDRADAAPSGAEPDQTGPDRAGSGADRAVSDQAVSGGRGRDSVFPTMPVSRPSQPVLDTSDDSAAGVRQAVQAGATGVLLASLLTALMSTTSDGASRVWAGLIGVIIFVAVLVWLGRRLSEPTAAVLSRLQKTNRRLAFGAYLTLVSPLLILVYALVGGLVPLIIGVVVAGVALVLGAKRR